MKKNFVALRKKAMALRRSGQSYNEIRRTVPVAKSTLSLWLKAIPMAARHKKRLYAKQIEILSRGPQSQKERRARETTQIVRAAQSEIKLPLSRDAYALFGAALYWAEGSKTKNFEITNSDPHLIFFMTKWFENIFDVPPTGLKAWLNIYPQQNEQKIKKFWSALTGIPIKNFGKSYIKPLSKGFKKNNLYYGTIKIYVPKSVDSRYRVFGWTRAVLQEIDSKVKFARKRWVALEKTVRPVNISS